MNWIYCKDEMPLAKKRVIFCADTGFGCATIHSGFFDGIGWWEDNGDEFWYRVYAWVYWPNPAPLPEEERA